MQVRGRKHHVLDRIEGTHNLSVGGSIPPRPTVSPVVLCPVEKSKSQNPRIIQDRLRAGCCASGIDPHTGTKAIVDQIHASLSSMFTQAFRWGWRDTNPAQWAEPSPAENEVPVVPTPEEVMELIDEANESRRPDKARAMFVVATTGLRRADICARKRDCDVDWERGIITVTRCVARRRGRSRRRTGELGRSRSTT
jgi:integrase